MTNKDITKIYFRGNEIVALYQGSTLIFKKSGSGKSIIRGKVYNINTPVKISINGGEYITVSVNEDKTFEYNIVDTITNCRSMFAKLDNNVDTLDLSNFDTSNVTDMTAMFRYCNITRADLSNFNTSNVTDMTAMFYQCDYNKDTLKLSNFDTSKVTSMNSMFYYFKGACDTLDLSNFDTSNVTDMSDMFKWSKIKNLYINFNVDKVVSNFSNIFNCSSLTNVVGKFEGTKNDLWITRAPLTAASAMVFINGLATVTETRRLTLSATTYDSLTPEQIAIATSKGWTVTRN